MRGYVYVEKALAAKVLSEGYQSARRRYEVDPQEQTSILLVKYGQQYDQAMQNKEYRDDLASFNRKQGNTTRAELILGYLDWRDEITLAGSRAIYFLFAPVPQTMKAAFNAARDNFCVDRVLLEISVPLDARVQVVDDVDHKSAEFYTAQGNAYWETTFRKALAMNPERDSLWFAGVPHAFFISESGQINTERVHGASQCVIA